VLQLKNALTTDSTCSSKRST